MRTLGSVRITVNGEEYGSWDEVPEETRHLLGQVLPDVDGNGVPDAFEGGADPGRHSYHKVIVTTPASPPAVPNGTRKVRVKVRRTIARLPDATGSTPPPDPSPDPSPDPAPGPPADGSTVPQGKILLNGELVDADPEPPRPHWWRRV
jgi:hypothetical protein